MVGLITGFGIIWAGKAIYDSRFMNNESGKQEEQIVEKPLLKYTIESLGKRSFQSEIVMDDRVAAPSAGSGQDFFVQKFHFDSDGKKVTGLAHIPKTCGPCPVIVQIRGYAEPEVYEPGYGTWRSAQKFAEAGFISLAPDFLGYGESDEPSGDVFEARFETYTTVLNFVSAVSGWESADGNKIGMWGHSNGGQIALTVLEVSGKNYPTTLWAPVTAGFPYSILYYMDGNEIGDRDLRKKLADFEEIYDAGEFALVNYLDRIKASVQIHQGTEDKSVPAEWNRNFVKKVPNARYWEYPGADHNLSPDWNTVVERDIVFFRENLGLTEYK